MFLANKCYISYIYLVTVTKMKVKKGFYGLGQIMDEGMSWHDIVHWVSEVREL